LPSIVILRPKPEVKVEDEDVDATAKIAALIRRQRLNVSCDDAEGTPKLNTTWMESRNDHTAWAGKIDDVIAMSIRDSDRPLVDLTATTKKQVLAAP
jgi:hypothetical protein